MVICNLLQSSLYLADDWRHETLCSRFSINSRQLSSSSSIYIYIYICTIYHFLFKFGGSDTQIIRNNFDFDEILIILGTRCVFPGKKFHKFEGKMSVIFILCHIYIYIYRKLLAVSHF